MRRWMNKDKTGICFIPTSKCDQCWHIQKMLDNTNPKSQNGWIRAITDAFDDDIGQNANADGGDCSSEGDEDESLSESDEEISSEDA